MSFSVPRGNLASSPPVDTSINRIRLSGFVVENPPKAPETQVPSAASLTSFVPSGENATAEYQSRCPIFWTVDLCDVSTSQKVISPLNAALTSRGEVTSSL